LRGAVWSFSSQRSMIVFANEAGSVLKVDSKDASGKSTPGFRRSSGSRLRFKARRSATPGSPSSARRCARRTRPIPWWWAMPPPEAIVACMVRRQQSE
jgi:hypothetical protein